MKQRIEAQTERFLASEQGKIWLEKFCQARGEQTSAIESEFGENFARLAGESGESCTPEDIARALACVWNKVYRSESGQADAELNPDTLRHDVINYFPRPVACAYERYANADSASEGFFAMLDTVEAISHCLCSIALGLYFAQSNRDCEWDGELLSALCIRKISFGTWVEMGIGTAKRLPTDSPFGEVVACLQQEETRKLLYGFVHLRNGFAHACCRTEALFAAHLEMCQPNLQSLLVRTLFLRQIDLLVPLQYQDDKVVRADRYAGTQRYKNVSLNPPLDLGAKAAQLPEEKAIIACKRGGGEWVALYPLWLWHYWVHKKSQGAYCLSSIDCDLEEKEVQLKSVKYLSYEVRLAGEDPWCPRKGERDANAIKHILDSLKTSRQELTNKSEEPEDNGELAVLEQRQHLAWFVGREKLIQEWQQALLKKNGYLLVRDAPGAGKSAMAAKIAQVLRDEGHAVLLHMVRSQPEPHRFVPALVRQGFRCLQEKAPSTTPGEKPDESLQRMLDRLSRRMGRAILILDGLDEMTETSQKCEWLPRHLPDNVCVLLTSRPGEQLLDNLRKRVGLITPLPDLKPLARKEIDELVRKKLDPAKQALLRKSARCAIMYQFIHFPLCIVIALNIMQDYELWPEQDRQDLQRLERGIEEQHQAIFSAWYDHASGRHKREVAETVRETRKKMLHLLAVSQATLSLYDLQNLLALDNMAMNLEQVRDALSGFYEYLLEKSREEFVLCHQAFGEYVCRRIGDEEVKRLHTLFSRWLEEEANRGSEKGMQHVGYSLCQIGQYDRLVARLTDLNFCYQRIRAGQAESLVGDLYKAINLLPPRYPGFERVQILAQSSKGCTDVQDFWSRVYKYIRNQESKRVLQDWLDLIEVRLYKFPEVAADQEPFVQDIPGDFMDMIFLQDGQTIALLHEHGIDTYDCNSRQKIQQINLAPDTNPRKIFFDPEKQQIILWRIEKKTGEKFNSEKATCSIVSCEGGKETVYEYLRYYNLEGRRIYETTVPPRCIWNSDGRKLLMYEPNLMFSRESLKDLLILGLIVTLLGLFIEIDRYWLEMLLQLGIGTFLFFILREHSRTAQITDTQGQNGIRIADRPLSWPSFYQFTSDHRWLTVVRQDDYSQHLFVKKVYREMIIWDAKYGRDQLFYEDEHPVPAKGLKKHIQVINVEHYPQKVQYECNYLTRDLYYDNVAISQDGQFLAIAPNPHELRIVRLESKREQLIRLEKFRIDRLYHIMSGPNPILIFQCTRTETENRDSDICLLDAESMTVKEISPGKSVPGALIFNTRRDVALSPDEKRLAIRLASGVSIYHLDEIVAQDQPAGTQQSPSPATSTS